MTNVLKCDNGGMKKREIGIRIAVKSSIHILNS